MKSLVKSFLVLQFLVSAVLASAQTNLSLDLEKTNHLEITQTGNAYKVVTTGIDPYIFTKPLEQARQSNDMVLAFEYFCPKGLDHIQVYFGPEIGEGRSKLAGKIGVAEGWVRYSIDLSEEIGDWGKRGDFLRIDLGKKEKLNLQIRNIHLRAMTAREIEIVQNKETKKREEAKIEKHIRTYLDSDFASSVDYVSVRDSTIVIKGVLKQKSGLIAEVPPNLDVTEAQTFLTKIPVKEGDFEVVVARFNKNGKAQYDRLLSKWVLISEKDKRPYLISHAHYADEIIALNDLPDEKATSKKGLGGFGIGRGHTEDLKELDITSATINIWFTRFMYTKPAPDRIKHTYMGKDWYFGLKDVEGLDKTFQLTAEKNIITAAILLVASAEDCPDPKVGKLLQHPDMDPAGIYSMPNMTTPESVECYAAALDFLASRYSREDKKYGRINHWIMHNEVDAGWVWTNMGEKTELIFMDTYVKSMRMCYNIARSYNPHSEVFITLTHYWAWTIDDKFYPSKNLMEILLDYTHTEGDFEWAMAQHPYPESLFEPKTWLDQKVDFTFESPLITFKNIEVLDAWIKQPEALYKGKHKRTLWLSENGTNSKTYSEQDLKEQAAGFAYTWKKLKNLDGIDGFQWHNWFDHRREGGLRIGLRRFPDDEEDPGGAKPVWYVFQAADRENEDQVFDQYKSLIGIDHWNQVNFIGEIDQQKEEQTYRNVMADTWVATDALGRDLTGFEQNGAKKQDRYVGMFYFITHTKTGGSGPFDVSKIIAENPENPKWGNGSHYWGEPELGYYLNTEKWVHKRHARQLVDAGVDVIIFDATNNKTYPEVYIPLCEAWREMRAMGEKTPDIAFLGSEISVNTLWSDFYLKGMYPDLWFMWKGKPLLLYGWHEQPQRKKINEVTFSDDIQKFFSLRQSWAWTSLPWYDDGKDEWPWVDHYPQTVGWSAHDSIPEQVPVAAAQHPLSNIGRSFHEFHQPANDKYDLTPVTDQGLYFQEQWDRALDVDPEFIFVTGWNEWSAGKQTMKEPKNENLLKWSFYPGAHLGKVGEPLNIGDEYFIDQYNQEYSRDIEPMTGGHTDNYYYQLVDNIRKYKGVGAPIEAQGMIPIELSSGFNQWLDVSATYYDHIGDVEHRNSAGTGQAGPYLNTSGRNDIIESKVAYDSDYIYFYAKTKEALTPHTGSNWMLLYLNTDQDHATGWEGYDFLINASILDAGKTTISTWKKGTWKTAGEIRYRYQGNELMLAVPKELIDEKTVAFDFHWADNPKSTKDMRSFFLDGDSAPDRRFNYRYSE